MRPESERDSDHHANLLRWRETEWLETDGLGGFATGTAAGIRTRRYHGLLVAARRPPSERVMLVNGFEAWLDLADGTWPLSSQEYAPNVIHPAGRDFLQDFTSVPWPTWTYHFPSGLTIQQELLMPRGKSATVLRWNVTDWGTVEGSGTTLQVRFLISGRDYHHVQRENSALRMSSLEEGPQSVAWQTYDSQPAIRLHHNGRYTSAPDWYRNFLYSEERSRGLDDIEDLATPGVISWDLQQGPALCLVTHNLPHGLSHQGAVDDTFWDVLSRREQQRRQRQGAGIDQAAESYLVRRQHGLTIVAGYPWFTDWGRDTFISLRGLCLATGRLAEARQILLEWSDTVSEGMLPNRFPDVGAAAEFNSVDASLWFVIAVYEFLQLAADSNVLSTKDESRLITAVGQILTGYAEGTRYNIRCDEDGLLSAGAEGYALTWMDAIVNQRAITPRIGKPVEIQALWINALRIGAELLDIPLPDWHRSQARFRQKFWLADVGYLADVVDVDHVPGAVDRALRPNQVLAAGGLPFPVLSTEQAASVVQIVEQELWTPAGLRTLSRSHPDYRPHYSGGPAERDAAYHQGTVWPWLLGPFIDAWRSVHGNDTSAQMTISERFLTPFETLFAARFHGRGHLPEIADAEPPHAARGCPFQAWSLGEYLRIRHSLT